MLENHVMSAGRCFVALACAVLVPSLATAQETDITQTPNLANAGIKKSYLDQTGGGRGDVFTPGSSAYIIARDPFRAVSRGRQIFQRKFTLAQGLGPRSNDGIGDIGVDRSHGAGLADSCAACHGRPQGAAGFGGDVFTRTSSRDAPHLFGLGLQEMLADEITADLRQLRDQALAAAQSSGTNVTVALQSKRVSFGSLTARPDGSLDTSGVDGVNADLRVRPFFAEGSTISIREFLVGAFNAEMGLESPDPDLIAAAANGDVVTPAGMALTGSVDDIEGAAAGGPLDDPDGDGVTNEIPESIADFLEFYLLNYFRPALRSETSSFDPLSPQGVGLRFFKQVGCTSCHVQNFLVEKDRRVADVETLLDRVNGNSYNNLFATATPLFSEIDDGSGLPPLRSPNGGSFVVENFFADFKRHDLGPNFWEKNFDGSVQKEFMTEPLWGVASTSPYGHDGRSPTLEDVILRHGGDAQASRDEFDALNPRQKAAILDFLGSLVIFSPPATASNLNPVNSSATDFPVNGHGSIDLAVLFVDPTDKE